MYQHHIQQAVIHRRVRSRQIPAAIEPPVADGGHHVAAFQHCIVQRYPQPVVKIAESGLHDGQRIGHAATAQREAAEFRDAVSDLCVQSGRADIHAAAKGCGDGIHGDDFSVQLGGHIQKRLFCGKIPHVIVSAAAGHAPHRQPGTAHSALQHFVQGSVPSAGIQPHFLGTGGSLRGDLPCVTGMCGPDDLHRNTRLAAGCFNSGDQPAACIPLSRGGIDDENAFHDRLLSRAATEIQFLF